MWLPDRDEATRCAVCVRPAIVGCDGCDRPLCELHLHASRSSDRPADAVARQLCSACSSEATERRARLIRAEEQAAALLIRAARPPGGDAVQDALWWGRQLRPVIRDSVVGWDSATELPVSAIRGGIATALGSAGLVGGDADRVIEALVGAMDDEETSGYDTVPVERRIGAGYRDQLGWLLGPLPGPIRGQRVAPALLLARTSLYEGRAEWTPSGALVPVGGFSLVKETTAHIVALVAGVAHRCAAPVDAGEISCR